MAFVKKTWKKRLSEYPTRRQLTYTNGTTAIVDVARLEGTISQEGDAFSDTNMNDLEQRVADAFTECFQSVSDGKALVASAITGKGVTTASDAAFAVMAANISNISTMGANGNAVLGIGALSKNTITGVAEAHSYDDTCLEARSDNQFEVLKAGTYRAAMYSQNSVSHFRVNGTNTSLEYGVTYKEFNLKVGDIVSFYREVASGYSMYCCGYLVLVE